MADKDHYAPKPLFEESEEDRKQVEELLGPPPANGKAGPELVAAQDVKPVKAKKTARHARADKPKTGKKIAIRSFDDPKPEPEEESAAHIPANDEPDAEKQAGAGDMIDTKADDVPEQAAADDYLEGIGSEDGQETDIAPETSDELKEKPEKEPEPQDETGGIMPDRTPADDEVEEVPEPEEAKEEPEAESETTEETSDDIYDGEIIDEEEDSDEVKLGAKSGTEEPPEADEPEEKPEEEFQEASVAPAEEVKKHKAPEGPLIIKHMADPTIMPTPKPATTPPATRPKPPAFEKDEKLDAVVSDIVARESDALLAAEDEKRRAEAFKPKPKAKGRLRRLIGAWWRHKRIRNATFLVLFAGIFAAGILPVSRYAILNAAGVRVSASVRIIDQNTQLPLKNAFIIGDSFEERSNEDGVITLRNMKLGKHDISIEKRAFAEVRRTVTLGLGSNPLGEVALEPTGAQYKILATQWLSDKPVNKAEASFGENVALSNDRGEITLVLDASDVDSGKSEVTIKADGYREEKLPLPTDTKSQLKISLVPAYPQIFVSKRSGKYDIYRIDVDGKNEKLLVGGTGKEREDISLAVDDKNGLAAYVSTRDGQANKDGYLLQTLNMIDIKTGALTKVTTSEQIVLAGFADGRLLYVKIAEGASGTNPKRQRLMSYNASEKTDKEIASSNYFNDEILIGNKLYYAPSNAFQENNNIGLFRTDPVGLKIDKLADKEVWNMVRVDYDHINYNVQQKWYSLSLKDGKSTELSAAPTNMRSRNFNENADGSHVIWSEERDGKGVLLHYDKQSGKDTELLRKSGLKTPMRWVGDAFLVFRVKSEQETADYVINVEGGDPKKITDVTDTSSVDRWYYY